VVGGRQIAHGQYEMVRGRLARGHAVGGDAADVTMNGVSERVQHLGQCTVEVVAVAAAPVERDTPRGRVGIDVPALPTLDPQSLGGNALDLAAVQLAQRLERRRFGIDAEAIEIRADQLLLQRAPTALHMDRIPSIACIPRIWLQWPAA